MRRLSVVQTPLGARRDRRVERRFECGLCYSAAAARADAVPRSRSTVRDRNSLRSVRRRAPVCLPFSPAALYESDIHSNCDACPPHIYRLGIASHVARSVELLDRRIVLSRSARANFSMERVSRWPRLSIVLMGAALSQLGLDEWSARLVPALVGVISVPAIYFPARHLVGRWTALFAVSSGNFALAPVLVAERSVLHDSGVAVRPRRVDVFSRYRAEPTLVARAVAWAFPAGPFVSSTWPCYWPQSRSRL